MAAGVGAIKDRQVFFCEMWSAFKGHSATNKQFSFINLVFGIAELGEHIKIFVVKIIIRQAQGFLTKGFAQDPFVKDELYIKGFCQVLFYSPENVVRESLNLKGFMVNAGCILECTTSNCVINHIIDLVYPVTKPAKSEGGHTVYDLEVPSPS